MNAGMDQPVPRHFLRRLIAYGIDVTIGWLIVALLYSVLATDTIGDELKSPETQYGFGAMFRSYEFRPFFYVNSITCGTPPGISPVFQNLVSPAKIASAKICFTRSFGVPVEGVAALRLENTPAAGQWAGKTVEIPLTLTSNLRFVDLYSISAFLVLSILSLRMFRTTPGKKLLGLRVDSQRPIPALRREVIRNLPHILSVVGIGVLNEVARPYPSVPPILETLAIAVQILALCAALYLWVWPLLRWRGAFFHDRWLGLKVIRSNAAIVAAKDPAP
jgi:hypothetical protein